MIKFRWVATAVAALGIGLFVLQATGRVSLADLPGRSAPRSAVPAATPELNPLQIEAMRQRKYIASELKVSEDLGDQGGFRSTISSFVSDGFTEYALVSTPSVPQPSGGWPVIIIAHGYINPAEYRTNDANYQAIVAELARAGYLVVKPDYRGHGQSQGSATGGHFSPAYAYDVLNLIATLKHYSPADPRRIGLLGHSLGGHVALRTIVVSPDVKATVIMSGVVGSMDDLLYHWDNAPAIRDRPVATAVQSLKAQLLQQFGTSQTNPQFWASASAINYVSAVKGPVQLHHSVGDSTVPVLFSDHLAAALLAAHKPAEYYQYPGDDHQLAASHALVMQRVLAFYAAHL